MGAKDYASFLYLIRVGFADFLFAMLSKQPCVTSVTSGAAERISLPLLQTNSCPTPEAVVIEVWLSLFRCNPEGVQNLKRRGEQVREPYVEMYSYVP